MKVTIPHDYVHPHQRHFDREALLKYGSDDLLALGVEQVLDDPGFQRVLRKAGRPRRGESDTAARVLGTFRTPVVESDEARSVRFAEQRAREQGARNDLLWGRRARQG